VADVSGAASATVLLVDDNAELLEVMSNALTHLGNFNVVRAVDGTEGLELAVSVDPACIVVDVVLPGLDGYQLVRALRGDPATASIPVVMLTALAQDRNRLAGLVSGADQYLVKPVKPQDLIASIRQAITLGQAERMKRLRALAEGSEGWDP
jgi:two-component system alkaline phosphatase synthesis response regulator PhoP